MSEHAASQGIFGTIAELFSPVTSLWSTLPKEIQIGVPVAILIGLGMVLYKRYYEETDEFQTTTLEERIERVYKKPMELQGGKIRDYIYKEASGNTKRLIGIAVKVLEDSAKVDVPVKKDSDEDKEKDFDTIQYVVVHGHDKWDIWMKYILYKACDSLRWLGGKYKLAEYQEIPSDYIRVESGDIVISKNAYLVTDDGLWRDTSYIAAKKIDNRAFITAHHDDMETLMQLGEIYAQLNTRVQGQLKLENIRSENIRKYEQQKRKGQLDNVMS